MSASAGKVMPRPMGDYNALTEYKVLDIVTYNDRPYMAKQTTTGNLPTNTTYWMLLLDFPTQVDNVPTQNSQNLVKSGGVYDATADKMKKDGSNADNVVFGLSSGSLNYVNVEKDAGDNQTVTITKTISSGYYVDKDIADAKNFLEAIVGSDAYFRATGNVKKYVIVDSVSVSSNVITALAHLKVDDSAAISESLVTLTFDDEPNGSHNLINGSGVVNGNNNRISGDGVINNSNGSIDGSLCTVSGDYARAEGYDCLAEGNYSIAGGVHSYAKGASSTARGKGTLTQYEGQTAIGLFNNNKQGNLLEIGCGSVTNRENIFEVNNDGFISCNDGTDKYKFAKSGGVDGFYDSSNDFHPFTGYREFVNNSVVLSTSADTTVTFSNAAITADSTIEPFTSVWGINPSNVVASAGSCTVTIPKQSTAQTINVKIRVS